MAAGSSVAREGLGPLITFGYSGGAASFRSRPPGLAAAEVSTIAPTFRSVQVAFGRGASNSTIQVLALGAPLQPPRPPASPPQQLWSRPGPFVNRADELRRLEAALREEATTGGGRPVAITGPWGSGVSSTAMELAWRMRHLYPDGQVLVDLGQPGEDLDDLMAWLLWWLGVPVAEQREQDRRKRYRSALAGKRLLFVLLNADDGQILSRLLPGVPGCGVIVTSRDERVGLGAAARQHLGPMGPEATQELLRSVIAPDRVAREPHEVLTIGRWCAGDPLITSLVAGWIQQPANRIRRLSAMRSELDGRRLLHLLDRDPQRRAALDAARRTLSRAAWELVRSSSLLPFDTFEVGLAAKVAGLSMPTARTAVSELYHAGLVNLPAGEADDRVRLLRTVREYARLRTPLPGTRRREVVRTALNWYLDRTRLDDDAGPAEVDRVLDYARQERSRIITTIAWGVRERLHDLAWQLAVRCGRLFRAVGFDAAWERTAELGLQAAERVDQPLAVALAAENLGDVRLHRGLVDQAVECYERSRNRRLLFEHDPVRLAQLQFKLGGAYERAERLPNARASYREALELLGDGRPEQVLPTLRRLVDLAAAERLDDPQAAAADAERGRDLCERLSDQHGRVWFLIRFGRLLHRSGSSELAHEHLAAAEGQARGLGDLALQRDAAQYLGEVLCTLDRPAAAAAALRRAAAAAEELGALPAAVSALRRSAELYRRAGQHQEAQAALDAWGALVGDHDRPARIAAQLALGEACLEVDDLDGAKAAFSTCRKLARMKGDELARARSLDGLSKVWDRQARASASGLDRELAEHAAAAAGDAADLFERYNREHLRRVRALARCGSLRLLLDQPLPAVEALAAGSAAAERAGLPPEEQADVLEELAAAWERLGGDDHRRQAAATLKQRGELMRRHGIGDPAEPLARAARLFEELREAKEAAATYTTLGEVHRGRGEHAEAAEAFLRANRPKDAITSLHAAVGAAKTPASRAAAQQRLAQLRKRQGAASGETWNPGRFRDRAKGLPGVSRPPGPRRGPGGPTRGLGGMGR